MTDRAATNGRRKPPRPLDSARLEELALAYVARFATTAAKLSTYLRRKLRERGYVDECGGEEEPDIAALVERFVASGYVDDAAYGRARAGGLVARGYGARRVDAALRAAGVEEAVREECAPGEAARRGAALALARKRGFGPFGLNRENGREEDREAARKRREKQLAAMMRAGHDFAVARLVIGAPTIEELEQWVAQVESDDGI